MRLGVAATPEVAIPTLEWLHSSKHAIELIITQPDKPVGRGRLLTQTPVADWAEQHKIEVVKPTSSTELNGVIDNLDCVITIGYGVLLPQAVLDLPRHGFLNLHFSLLPQYRGAAPAQYALLHGVEKTGVTVFQLDKGMDTGPIFSQIEVGIDPQWRSFELLKVLAERGVEAVDQALESLDDAFAVNEAKRLTAQRGRHGAFVFLEELKATLVSRAERPSGHKFKRNPLWQKGYSKHQVDLLLASVAGYFAGTDRITVEQLRRTVFSPRWGGYVENQVDAYIDRVVEHLQVGKSVL